MDNSLALSSCSRHQPKLRDHGYGASVLHGVPVYAPACACTKLYCLVPEVNVRKRHAAVGLTPRSPTTTLQVQHPNHWFDTGNSNNRQAKTIRDIKILKIRKKFIKFHENKSYHGLYGGTSCCISHGPSQWERVICNPTHLRPHNRFSWNLNHITTFRTRPHMQNGWSGQIASLTHESFCPFFLS